MAIYTRFGGKITLLRSTGDDWYIVQTEDGRVREWHLSDFRADGGLAEINEAIAALGEPSESMNKLILRRLNDDIEF